MELEIINLYTPNHNLGKNAFEKLENKFFLKNKSYMLNLFYGKLKRNYICEYGHIFII